MSEVFISYSRDSAEHEKRVLELAYRLRVDGVDAMIDQFETAPPEGVQLWMEKQIRDAKFVLLLCTETYRRRVMKDDAGKGLGVMWEAAIIYAHLYNVGGINNKFIPVLFALDDRQFIPTPLQSAIFYDVSTDDGYELLYRRLTDQPATPAGPIGARRLMATTASRTGSHGPPVVETLTLQREPSGHRQMLIRHYTNKFSDLPFDEIIKKYTRFEKKLLDEAVLDVSNFLIGGGFTLGDENKASYQKGNEIVTIHLSFLDSSRTLLVTLQSLFPKDADESVPAIVDGFGNVRYIEVRFHKSFPLDPIILVERLKDRFVAAYDVFETAFIRSSADFTETAYQGLYGTLEAALKAHDKADYFPKCRFAIANEEIGFYYFDPTTIRTIVALLKSDQSAFYSPVELSIWLITSPFPFQKSVGLESLKRGYIPITLPFSSNRYIHEAPQVVRATIELFGTEDYSVQAICKVRSFFLVIAVPADHSQVVLPVISAQKKVLKHVFEKGIASCSPIIETLREASVGIRSRTVQEIFKDKTH